MASNGRYSIKIYISYGINFRKDRLKTILGETYIIDIRACAGVVLPQSPPLPPRRMNYDDEPGGDYSYLLGDDELPVLVRGFTEDREMGAEAFFWTN